MVIKRDLEKKCLELAKKYPVLTITGPRQSGKTTLTKTVFDSYAYVNLEAPDIRAFAIDDPRGFLNQYSNKVIIDEIQRAPELLSYIQTIVDEENREGMYILTGSHQMALSNALSQSLAGRTAILELLPLSFKELQQADINLSTQQQILLGGFPRLHQKDLNPQQFFRDYLKTYLERDVRELINIKDLLSFQKFLKLCAARTGSVLNMNNLAVEVGVSHTTIKSWLSILQASYIIVLVAPYFENFGKQIIKSPKLYFTDVGLAAYLLEIETESQVERDPLRGNLFETMVVIELIKSRYNMGLDPHLYYFRDKSQREIDVIFKQGNQLIPIEIKSGQTVNQAYFKNLHYFKKLVDERCGQPYVLYGGEQEMLLDGIQTLNFRQASELLATLKDNK